MNLKLTLLAAFLSAARVGAQSAVWGQCGGIGWTGPTTCVAGTTCTVINSYYYQCLPGSGGTTTTTTSTTSTTTTPNPQPTGNELPYGTLVTGCSVAGTVALTFDDGPHSWTSALIDSLNSAGVKATFFVVGKMYGCIYDNADTLKKAYNSGHQIASHTWSHQDLGGASASTVATEMGRVETALKKILGIRPKWWRPPYGSQNSNLLNTMRGLGYKTVTWNLDTQDWNNVGVAASQAKFNGLSSDPRIIPLSHDALQTTAQQLGPWMANWAKSKGLRAVTLSECLGEPVPGGQYDIVGGAGVRDSTWNCN